MGIPSNWDLQMSDNNENGMSPSDEMAGTAVLPYEPRSVPAGHGLAWLVQGFHYFKLNPGPWVVSIIIVFVVNVLVVLIPIIGSVAVSIASPVFIAGYMLGCQARIEGNDFEITHPFAAFSRNTGQLVLAGILYMVASIAIMMLFMAVAGGSFVMIADIDTMQAGDPDTLHLATESIGPMFFGSLIATLFYLPVLMLYWFAPALIVLHDMPALQAMQLSFRGCFKNFVPFLVYGIISLLLWILAVVPFLLGLLIVAPIVMASIHAAYRDIFLKVDQNIQAV